MKKFDSDRLSGVVVDVDGTLAYSPSNGDYATCNPISHMVSFLKECRKAEIPITIYTSRNMRTFEGNIGKINANTLPILINWLNMHDIPYDEIVVGKPWPGTNGIYIDDRSVRPQEILNKSLSEVLAIIENK